MDSSARLHSGTVADIPLCTASCGTHRSNSPGKARAAPFTRKLYGFQNGIDAQTTPILSWIEKRIHARQAVVCDVDTATAINRSTCLNSSSMVSPPGE